jgi:hypothetical protein
MKKIKSLNEGIDATKSELEVYIAELMEREEFSCPCLGCGGVSPDVQAHWDCQLHNFG